MPCEVAFPEQDERANQRTGPDHGLGFGLACAREVFWFRKDEDTWS